jgi:hypothetical protein
MTTTVLDEPRYRKLLGNALPVVIRTEAEYERLLHVAKALTEKPEEESTEEEGRLLELLSVLIEGYEDRVHPLPMTQPHKMLAFLLEEKGMNQTISGACFPKAACPRSSTENVVSVNLRQSNSRNCSACLSTYFYRAYLECRFKPPAPPSRSPPGLRHAAPPPRQRHRNSQSPPPD